MKARAPVEEWVWGDGNDGNVNSSEAMRNCATNPNEVDVAFQKGQPLMRNFCPVKNRSNTGAVCCLETFIQLSRLRKKGLTLVHLHKLHLKVVRSRTPYRSIETRHGFLAVASKGHRGPGLDGSKVVYVVILRLLVTHCVLYCFVHCMAAGAGETNA